MNREEYERIRRAVEEDCRRKIEALDLVASLFEQHGSASEEPPHDAEADSLLPPSVPPPEVAASAEPERGTPDSPGSRVCKDCEKEKPLDEFRPWKTGNGATGRRYRCKDCEKERARGRRPAAHPPEPDGSDGGDGPDEPKSEPAATTTVYPKQERAPEPSRTPNKNGAAVRRCANGERCVAHGQIGEPAKLNGGNPGPLCYGCEERDVA